MANLVVDASVAIKWFVAEPLSTEARRILDDYQAGTLSLVAPDLINAEFGNIVWKKRTFQGLGAGDAKALIDGFRKLEIAFTPTAELLGDAYDLAIVHRRTNAVSSVLPVVWLANWP